MTSKNQNEAPAAPSIVHVVEASKALEELKKATSEAELEVVLAHLEEVELSKVLKGREPSETSK